jgi:cell division protein FtsB
VRGVKTSKTQWLFTEAGLLRYLATSRSAIGQATAAWIFLETLPRFFREDCKLKRQNCALRRENAKLNDDITRLEEENGDLADIIMDPTGKLLEFIQHGAKLRERIAALEAEHKKANRAARLCSRSRKRAREAISKHKVLNSDI